MIASAAAAPGEIPGERWATHLSEETTDGKTDRSTAFRVAGVRYQEVFADY